MTDSERHRQPIAAGSYNRPLLLAPAYLGMLARGGVGAVRADAGAVVAPVVAGAMVIPVRGVLVRGDTAGPWHTGYGAIGRMLDRAAADAAIDTVVLDIDSGGGDAQGAFDLAARIASFPKPVDARVNENALSAAFLLAAAADRVVAPRTGMVGSIGVIASHMDISAMLASQGVTVSIVEAPADGRKSALSPLRALSGEARQDVQAKLDYFYDLFVAAVAAGRKIAPDVVRDTRARILTARDALAIGLIDAIQPTQPTGEPAMPDPEPGVQTPAIRADDSLDDLAGRQTRPDKRSGSADDSFDGLVDRQTRPDKRSGSAGGGLAGKERERIGGILTAPAARGRLDLALHLALGTDMGVAAAVAILEAAPPAAERAAGQDKQDDNAFRQAMDSGAEANAVPADPAADDGLEPAGIDRILEAYRHATGQNTSGQNTNRTEV